VTNPLLGLFRSRDKPRNAVSAAPAFFFGMSGAGKSVTPRSAIQVSVVYACVRVIAETAASAGTVLAMAADRLEMTPGSLWMVHDPSTFAWGNERDLNEAVNLLRACKESILNVYGKRCPKPREEVAAMMNAATWMDANQALEDGFIDGIAEDAPSANSSNATGPRAVNRREAEAKVQAWLERRRQHPPSPPPEDRPEEQPPPSKNTGIPIAQLDHRLGLLKPIENT